jgi:hypothetical protein
VDALKAIRKTWNDIDDGAPHVPQEMYDAVVRKLMRSNGPDPGGAPSEVRAVARSLDRSSAA